jgi:hypothetical protein
VVVLKAGDHTERHERAVRGAADHDLTPATASRPTRPARVRHSARFACPACVTIACSFLAPYAM